MTKPIHILHVLGGLDAGGAESFVMNLYRSIDRTKVQFDFIKHVSQKGMFEDEILSLGGKIFICPRYTGKNHFKYCKWWNEFFFNHPEYKIIHGHVRSTSAIYLLIAKKHGLITIIHSHSTSNGKGTMGMLKTVMQYPTRYIADYLFACSEKAGKWMYGQYVSPKLNYKIVPNGIDLARFEFKLQKRKQIRQYLGIQDNEMVIGHVGRFTAAKNHEFLIRVFQAYREKHAYAKLLLVGEGELLESIKSKCRELNILENVIFTGNRSDTENFYQAMDVMAFPSLWEGLGIVLIEAQANNLPCFVSKTIPKEAIITDSVKTLSLHEIRPWVKEIENLKKCDRSAPMNMGLQKYNMKTISRKMQKFYLEKCMKGKE